MTGGKLRFCLSGGAGLKVEIKQHLHAHGLLIIEGYGLTETSPTLTLNRPGAFRFDTVGQVVPSVQVKLADDGEILAKGANVFSGYYDDPEATAAAFTSDGWFCTGDVGRFTEDGFLQIIDRKKDILVTAGGKNIPPANIEARFADDPIIERVVVYGDARPFLVAAVWLRPEAAAKLAGDERAQAIAARLEVVNAELARYETIKRHFVVEAPLSVDDGTLTSSLKMRRKAVYGKLRARFEALYSLRRPMNAPPKKSPLDSIAALLRRAPKGPAVVGATPHTVAWSENKWRLLRFTPAVKKYARPILFVPSLINRWYVLDLGPGRSLIEWLVARGHEVFCIDWGTPGAEDRFLTWDDIGGKYLGRAIRVAARLGGAGDVHVLGYCLGGTLATAYVAAFPEHVATLLALAAPIDFDHAGIMALWTRTPAFDVGAIVEAFGNVPWQLMQASFKLLKPTLDAQKLVGVLDRAWDDEFLESFLATERWGTDNVSFPGATYARYIEALYRGNQLVRGGFSVCGRGRSTSARSAAPCSRSRSRTTTSCRSRRPRRSSSASAAATST